MSEPSSKDTVLKTAMIYVCGGKHIFKFSQNSHLFEVIF